VANPRIEDGYRTEQNTDHVVTWCNKPCRSMSWTCLVCHQRQTNSECQSQLQWTCQHSAENCFLAPRSTHTTHCEWRLQSQDPRRIFDPEIPALSIAQSWDLWIGIEKQVWNYLDGPKMSPYIMNEDCNLRIPDTFTIQRSPNWALPKPRICGSELLKWSGVTWTAQKSPYVIIINSNNCFRTIFTTAHMADTCTTYIRCIFFTHCHCSSSEKLLHSVRIQATTPTQSCSDKINPMFWQDPVIPARSWENQSGIAIPNYQVQRHSTL